MKRNRLVLGGGCFWCVETVFSNVKGVLGAISGYTGGLRPNPTTLNQQGGDRGTQYRSVIYYENDSMKEEITKFITMRQKDFSDKIVTEVTLIEEVYPAESYHQDYYRLNENQGYCQAVIAPKLQKFMTKFPNKIG